MQITLRPDLVAPLEAQAREEDRSVTNIVNRMIANQVEKRFKIVAPKDVDKPRTIVRPSP